MINRVYQDLETYIEAGKVLIMYGPRQVGKTTLLMEYLQTTPWKYKWDTGDNIRTRETMQSEDPIRISEYVAGYDLLVIDEAQQIPGIGQGLKILIDANPKLRVIATGSSSFELAAQVGEPLVGRKITLTLFPLSQIELLSVWNRYELREQLGQFLVFGSYPEIITETDQKKKIKKLEELASSYLFKDILSFEKIQNSQVLQQLVKLLAWQIGSQVSANELARALGIDAKTVQKYIDLLEKSFIIFRLGGYSKNLRNEVVRKQKYYFYDVGIRNAVIAQFNPIADRNDIGQLWENFIVVERLKKRSYQSIIANMYYWRTYDGQEIDLVEERSGALFAFECKWSDRKQARPPKSWLESYPEQEFTVVTQSNYFDIIL